MDSNQTIPSTAKGPLSPTDTAMLEALVPGYTLISQFFLSYLKIDIAAYLQYFMALAFLGASLRYIFRYFWTAFQECFICTAEIRLDDEVFNYFMYWMSRQPFMQRTNRFVAGVKTNGYWSDDDDSEGDEMDEEFDELSEPVGSADTDPFEEYLSRRKKIKHLRYTPSQGRHLFWYRGRPIILEREYKDLTTRWVLNNERLYLSCFGWDSSIIKTLMVEAQKAYMDRDRNRTVIYRAQKHGRNAQFLWTRCMARRPRPMSTVILGQQQKDAFINDMKDYLRQETWYTDRGIPYRRGYLFHGPPGTGKTSLCFAAAGKLRLTLYILSLNSKSLDDDNLMTLFAELPRQCIVLLEDVDSAGVTVTRSKPATKKSKKQKPNGTTSDPDHDSAAEGTEESASAETPSDKDGITLSGLLNVMDGVAASEGRILIMTTNHRDRLDEALTRNGRVDMEVEFGYTTSTDIKQLFTSIYLPSGGNLPRKKLPPGLSNGKHNPVANGTVRHNAERKPSPQQNGTHKKELPNHVEMLGPRITAQAVEFASIVPSGELTAAEIQGYLLNHKNSPESALQGAEAWVKRMREKKGLQ